MGFSKAWAELNKQYLEKQKKGNGNGKAKPAVVKNGKKK